MKYKTGIFSWYGYNTPIIKRLEKIKKAGFDSIMLWWGDKLAFQVTVKVSGDNNVHFS